MKLTDYKYTQLKEIFSKTHYNKLSKVKNKENIKRSNRKEACNL